MNKNMLDKFEFSSHICTNATRNINETLKMITDRELIGRECLGLTLKSDFNDIEIEVKNNGEITIFGIKDKSDLEKPFMEVARCDKEIDMNIFQNRKYDLLVEYTTENKQLFHYITLEELFQTDNVENILTIYDVGIVSDLTLLAWR